MLTLIVTIVFAGLPFLFAWMAYVAVHDRSMSQPQHLASHLINAGGFILSIVVNLAIWGVL